MPETHDAFYDHADEHIHLSNRQISESASKSEVSASMMYANARFSAWLSASWCGSKSEMEKHRAENITYFTEQFRKMLEENYDDYVDHFEM